MGLMEWLRKRWWRLQDEDPVGQTFDAKITKEAVDARQAKAEAENTLTRAEALREDSERTRQNIESKEFSEWLLGGSPRLRRRES